MKKNLKMILITLLLVVVFIIGISVTFLSFNLSKIHKKSLSKLPEDLGINKDLFGKIQTEGDLSISTGRKTSDAEKIVNIALFGIDAPKGQTGRSDSIIILTLDEIHSKIKLTSIMRDSYVNINGYGMDKINHAYAFGGPQLAIMTLNQNFKLNVRDYVTVNFSTLTEAIDSFGGVYVTIKDYEIPLMTEVGIESPGVYNLNGSQALAYCRIRYVGNGDYERTERQRTVLEALFNKVSPKQIPMLLNDIAPSLETSLSNIDFLSLLIKINSFNNEKLELQRFPHDSYCTGRMINSIWYLTFDLNITSNQVYKYIFEDLKSW